MPNGAGFHDYEEIYPVGDSEEEITHEYRGGRTHTKKHSPKIHPTRLFKS